MHRRAGHVLIPLILVSQAATQDPDPTKGSTAKQELAKDVTKLIEGLPKDERWQDCATRLVLLRESAATRLGTRLEAAVETEDHKLAKRILLVLNRMGMDARAASETPIDVLKRPVGLGRVDDLVIDDAKVSRRPGPEYLEEVVQGQGGVQGRDTEPTVQSAVLVAVPLPNHEGVLVRHQGQRLEQQPDAHPLRTGGDLELQHSGLVGQEPVVPAIQLGLERPSKQLGDGLSFVDHHPHQERS